MPYLETNNSVTIHYEDRGSGHPLLFVHGWSMAGPAWRFQESYFHDHFRCICVDLRGHGCSSSPETGYGIADFVSDLTSLCEQLDLRRATLVGWSMGAIIAIAAYPKLRSRLGSLVLVSGTPKFTSSEDYPFGLPERETRGLSLRLRRNPEQAFAAFYRMMFTQEESGGAISEYPDSDVVPLLRTPPNSAALQSLDTLAAADVRDLLPTISVPALLIHGNRDIICPAGASNYMTERITGSSLEIIDGAGHAPFLTRQEEFNRLMGDFLERVYAVD